MTCPDCDAMFDRCINELRVYSSFLIHTREEAKRVAKAAKKTLAPAVLQMLGTEAGMLLGRPGLEKGKRDE